MARPEGGVTMASDLDLDDVAATSPRAARELTELREDVARLRKALAELARVSESSHLPGSYGLVLCERAFDEYRAAQRAAQRPSPSEPRP